MGQQGATSQTPRSKPAIRSAHHSCDDTMPSQPRGQGQRQHTKPRRELLELILTGVTGPAARRRGQGTGGTILAQWARPTARCPTDAEPAQRTRHCRGVRGPHRARVARRTRATATRSRQPRHVAVLSAGAQAAAGRVSGLRQQPVPPHRAINALARATAAVPAGHAHAGAGVGGPGGAEEARAAGPTAGACVRGGRRAEAAGGTQLARPAQARGVAVAAHGARQRRGRGAASGAGVANGARALAQRVGLVAEAAVPTCTNDQRRHTAVCTNGTAT